MDNLKSAFPIEYSNGHEEAGLTKREYFTAMAMLGLLASGMFDTESCEKVAADSLRVVDATLKALEQ